MRLMVPLLAVGFIFTSCIPAAKDGPTIERIKPIDLVIEPVKPKPKDGTIIANTADWCVPCQKWKAECLDDLIAAGWDVTVVEEGSGPFPSFTVRAGGKETKWSGYSDRNGFIAKLKDLLSSKN